MLTKVLKSGTKGYRIKSSRVALSVIAKIPKGDLQKIKRKED